MEYRFCPYCGKGLETKEVEQRMRAYCPRCAIVHYTQLKVGAAALVIESGELLLLRRADAPFKGCWNLPAGYAETDESPGDAARREAREESGLDVQIDNLQGVYYFSDDPRGNGILTVYSGRIIGGTLTETAEGLEPTFFSRQELPSDLAGAGHDQAILDWRGEI